VAVTGRCPICQTHRRGFCTDRIACNFRARRRLGLGAGAWYEWLRRDLAQVDGDTLRLKAQEHDEEGA
jgi:hypothetical protein